MEDWDDENSKLRRGTNAKEIFIRLEFARLNERNADVSRSFELYCALQGDYLLNDRKYR